MTLKQNIIEKSEVRLRQEIGLTEAIALIVGAIIGSGIK